MSRKNRTKQANPGQRLWRILPACVAALFVAQPLTPGDVTLAFGGNVVFVMLWILVALAWLVGSIRAQTFELRFRWIDAAVLLLVGWYTVSGAVTANHGAARAAINASWQWVGIGMAYFMVRQLIVTAQQARALAAAMIALAVALAAVGLYQYFVSMPATRAEYAQNPEAVMRSLGEYYPPGPQRDRFEDRLASTEPMATFALANSLAGFLAPWLVVAIGVAAGMRASTETGRLRRILLLLAIGLAAGCLLLTKSRSALLATGMGFVLLAGGGRHWLNRRGLLLVAAAVVLLIVGVLVAGGADRQFFSEASKSLGYRLQYWRSTAAMISDHPLLGVGPGQFQDIYAHYKLPQASEEVNDPHNFVLEVWAVAGTPALLALLAVCGLLAHSMWRPARIAGANSPGNAAGEEADDAVWIQRGGLAGVIIGAVVALTAGFTPGLPVVLIMLIGVVSVQTILSNWMAGGALPPRLLGIAVLVLLVNLLAAGGIGEPSVAGTLWLLVALATLLAQPGGRVRQYSMHLAFVSAAGVGLAAVVLYVTAYRPVLQAENLLRQAAIAQEDAARQVLLANAVAADPRSSRVALAVAQNRLALWKQTPSPSADAVDPVIAAYRRAVELAPQSNVAWRQLGLALEQIHGMTGEAEHLKQAATALHEAALRYPNSGAIQAELATCLADLLASGAPLRAPADVRREMLAAAEQALRLDDVTQAAGHADRVLPDSTRARLHEIVAGPE